MTHGPAPGVRTLSKTARVGGFDILEWGSPEDAVDIAATGRSAHPQLVVQSGSLESSLAGG